MGKKKLWVVLIGFKEMKAVWGLGRDGRRRCVSFYYYFLDEAMIECNLCFKKMKYQYY